MTIREEIKNLLSQSGQTQYAFVNAYNAKCAEGEKITRSNFAAYLRGKDTLSIKKIDPILEYLREQCKAFLADDSFIGTRMFVNKNNSDQRIIIERSEISVFISIPSDNPKHPELLTANCYLEYAKTMTGGLLNFILSQFPDAEWEEYEIKNAAPTQ